MSAETTATGNLGQDPAIRYTPSGKQVLELRIACTASKKNQGGQWEDDGDPLWVTAAFWGEGYEHLADQLHKGDKVSVSGTLVQRGWQGNDGQTRTSLELRFPRFLGVVPKRQQGGYQAAPQGGQAGDPWATGDAPF